MKIVLCSLNFWPEVVGIGKYSWEMAEWLSARGHSVKVITAPPYYPAWTVSQGYHSTRYSFEKLGKVEVFRAPLWVPRSPSGLKRILHLLSFSVSSLPLLVWQVLWRPNIFITIEPPLMLAPVVWGVSKSCAAKCLLHVQDFEVDAAFDLDFLPDSSRFKNIILGLERFILRRFDRVSTISGKMLEALKRKGVKDQKRLFFPNWVDTSQVYPIPTSLKFKESLNIPDNKVILLYSGNIGVKQGLETLINVARKFESAQDKRFHFVFCGDGGERKRLMKLTKKLDNISWISLQPIEYLNDLLSIADIHLLPQRSDAADLVMPSKLTGILASGRPVIAAAHHGTQIAKMLHGIGTVIPPEDSSALEAAILKLGSCLETRLELGAKARIWAVENLDKERVLLQFETDLQNCLG